MTFLRRRLMARKREIELTMRARFEAYQHPTVEQRAELTEVRERLRGVSEEEK